MLVFAAGCCHCIARAVGSIQAGVLQLRGVDRAVTYKPLKGCQQIIVRGASENASLSQQQRSCKVQPCCSCNQEPNSHTMATLSIMTRNFCILQVAAVVSQPGKPKGRGNKAVPVPSPVEQLARQHLPEHAIMCPRSAKEVCTCASDGFQRQHSPSTAAVNSVQARARALSCSCTAHTMTAFLAIPYSTSIL